MTNIPENENILNPEIASLLHKYQIETLNKEVIEYLQINEASSTYIHEYCPKCHAYKPIYKSGGFTTDKYGNHKKHMLKCPVCNKRFVEDRGQLTYYSHLSEVLWDKIIKDTYKGTPLALTAKDIGYHLQTVFRNRHKLLNFLELSEDENIVKEVIEADEKYVHECHKGLVDAKYDQNGDLIINRSTHKKTDPGLGKDKACIITAVERTGCSYVKTYNMGKPTSEDIMKMKDHIVSNSFVYTDGIDSYKKMLEARTCKYKELVGIESYDAVNHLNTVNSFHSRISEWERKYTGVNTIYVNRYNALYSLRQKYTGLTSTEVLLRVKRDLRSRTHYFYQKQLSNEDIFDDEYALKPRIGLMSAIELAKI